MSPSLLVDEGPTGEEIMKLLSQQLRNAGPNGEKAEANVSSAETNGEVRYAPAGSLPKVRNLYEGQPDRRGRSTWTSEYPDDLEEPAENAESEQFALLIRNKKCYDGRKKLEIDSIVIQSELLKGVLGDVLKDYPGITTALKRVEFHAPFQPFVHRWEAFAKAREEATDSETRTHVNLLWKVLEEELRETIREKNDHVRNGVLRFDNIWTIFEPGCLVYHLDDGHDRVYRLKSGSFAQTRCGRVYHLQTEYVDWDGENFGLANEGIQIPAFGGTAPITKLSAFPLAFHSDVKKLRERVIARGQKFEELKGYHYKAYDGVAIGWGCWGPIKYSVSSRIIVDTYAFNRFNPNRKVNLDFMKTEMPDYDDDDDVDEIEPDERAQGKNTIGSTLKPDQLLLTTPTLRGYSLKDKKWLEFFVDSVSEIVWNESAFASLVAPPEQKDLILAFAQSQAKNKDRFDDVIQGKGRGIIMLLSGPPGVGKTLTAESVAETMKTPLYTMSAGDLGTQPSQVESALSNILEMNTKWNAVLLLDEADVFLEARSAHDLERNKLVSIFLRLLEYYEGILFLTTNRVENIDAAFESRIHLSLEYDELDEPSRKHVWNTFLKRASNVGNFEEAEVDTLAKQEMNGRQIKNVLKTAQLLASKQEAPLEFKHVQTVMKLRAKNSKKKAFEEKGN
jgi:ATPase family associated with various cellular activities (AAA)